MKFDQSVVLITGAAEGIGHACACELRARGARLTLVDRNPIPDCGPDVCRIQGDVTDPGTAERAVEQSMRAFGRIDVAINNAGVGIYASASTTPVDLARSMFDVNLFAAVHLVGLVTPIMRGQGGGAIVNIGSIGGLVSLPWCALYCASKFALHAFSESLRREVARDGIHVMTVIPGIVRTRFREHVLAGSAPAGVVDLKRTISSEALARAIANGLTRRKRRIIRPRFGALFYGIDLLFPFLLDRFFERCWSEERQSEVEQKVSSAY